MIENSFLWNGKNAEDMGVKVISLPPLSLSEENIEEVECDGRDGSLTILKGYKATDKEVEVDYIGDDPLTVAEWLTGSGKVVFGNRQDVYYNARINNVIPITEVIRNQIYNFKIIFRCQPFAYFNDNTPIVLTRSGINVNNQYHEAVPKITIYGSGAMNLFINQKHYYISEIGGSISIDSSIEEVLNGKGKYFESNNFPKLTKGSNVISYNGNVSKIEIIPNWRCL